MSEESRNSNLASANEEECRGDTASAVIAGGVVDDGTEDPSESHRLSTKEKPLDRLASITNTPEIDACCEPAVVAEKSIESSDDWSALNEVNKPEPEASGHDDISAESLKRNENTDNSVISSSEVGIPEGSSSVSEESNLKSNDLKTSDNSMTSSCQVEDGIPEGSSPASEENNLKSNDMKTSDSSMTSNCQGEDGIPEGNSSASEENNLKSNEKTSANSMTSSCQGEDGIPEGSSPASEENDLKSNDVKTSMTSSCQGDDGIPEGGSPASEENDVKSSDMKALMTSSCQGDDGIPEGGSPANEENDLKSSDVKTFMTSSCQGDDGIPEGGSPTSEENDLKSSDMKTFMTSSCQGDDGIPEGGSPTSEENDLKSSDMKTFMTSSCQGDDGIPEGGSPTSEENDLKSSDMKTFMTSSCQGDDGIPEGGSPTSEENDVKSSDMKTSEQHVKDGSPSVDTKSSQSVYLNDSKPAVTKEDPKPKLHKRMTKAEKAAMEALAAFGGSDFGSLTVRKIDLQEQLKLEAEMRKKCETENSQKDKSDERPLKRLQKAKVEVQKEFKDIAFGDGTKKYPKVTVAKQKVRLEEKNAGEKKSFVRYETRLQKSKSYASKAFDGVGLDKLEVRKERNIRSAHLKKRSADKQDKTETNSAGHTLTRRDKAKMEAIKTFDGDSLGAVLKGSRKRVARHFDNYPAKRAKAKESPDRDEASAANADSSTEASAN